MDPSIWGSKLWGIIFDTCWLLEKSGHLLSQKAIEATQIFFQSMRYLLPCKYCRDSYNIYLSQLNQCPPFGKGALKWGYDLKNLVNKKLDKKDIPKFECVQKRMKTWSCASSESDVWDILCMYATNYDCRKGAEKKYAFFEFLRTFPNLLWYLPGKRGLARILKTNSITEMDLKSRKNLLAYLCSCKKGSTAQNIEKQYSNCKVKKS